MTALLILLGCLVLSSWPLIKIFSFFWFNYLLYLVLSSFISTLFLGIGPQIKLVRMQNAINYAGLKNTQGVKPKVIKIVYIDDYRTKLFVKSIGVGPDKYEGKKNDLESTFKQKVEKVSFSKDREHVEIDLCKRELPTMIPFSHISSTPLKESSFVLGESLAGGILNQDISTLPHLLIGGTTGGGKSVFFKSTLINLLKTTPHLQMFLIDLKKGVEVREFGDLPNVRIAKNETEAIEVLQAVKDEMDKRYTYIEASSDKKVIIPKKDNKDLIVIGIDEASVLYGKTSTNKKKKELMQKARELTDELAKLARAAGIHLIIATQKPIKDSIDTKTLENLPGRISFKMSTHAGSNSMLGNGKAYSLPDVKGRAIWKGGNQFIEIQTPYISEEEILAEIESIKEGHESEKFKNLQPILELGKKEVRGQKDLNEETQKPT